MKDVGVSLGTRLARDAVGWMSPVLLKKFEHAAGLSLTCVGGASNIARFIKLVPMAGGIVAGGFDAAVTQLIGRTADRVLTSTMAAKP
jgi:uncharacterized protein (DUF697 family)